MVFTLNSFLFSLGLGKRPAKIVKIWFNTLFFRQKVTTFSKTKNPFEKLNITGYLVTACGPSIASPLISGVFSVCF